jgi:hypothetical protein
MLLGRVFCYYVLKLTNWIKTMMFRHKQVKGALLLAISFFTRTAFSFEIGMDIASSHGGDKLVKAAVITKDNVDNTYISAGDGIIIGVVARQKVISIFDITASIGYKSKTNEFNNGTFSFSTFPESVGLRANIHEFIGLEAGTVAFLNPEMTGSLVPPSTSVSSDPAQYLEISFNINEKTELALRFISGLVFKEKNGGDAKGDHVSFIARAFF